MVIRIEHLFGCVRVGYMVGGNTTYTNTRHNTPKNYYKNNSARSRTQTTTQNTTHFISELGQTLNPARFVGCLTNDCDDENECRARLELIYNLNFIHSEFAVAK